jgi:excisionase family DNA binding protein
VRACEGVCAVPGESAVPGWVVVVVHPLSSGGVAVVDAPAGGEAGRVIERLLTARELAELLGFQAGTIVDWAEAGTVPAFKIGGRLRFRESEVLAWLEEHRRGAA